MNNRGTLYIGILLIAFGGLFFAAEVTRGLVVWRIPLGWQGLWPFILLLVGLAFWLPLLIWWGKRQRLVGLVVPGTIILFNSLLLFYQNVTGDWESWAYVWALEPFAVGLGLLMLYALGERSSALLTAAGIVGGVGLVLFVIFASIFGGWVQVLGPAVLIIIGVLLLTHSMVNRLAD
ncbi:MAG: hypothetical protein ACLFV5_08215 [Anaerolineales bacterium]